MMIFNVVVLFCTLFIFPIFYVKRFLNSIPNSIVLLYSLVLSLTLAWMVFLVFFIAKLSVTTYVFKSFIYLVFLISVVLFYKNIYSAILRYKFLMLFTIFAFLLLYIFSDKIFMDWDALVSWNRWAIELANNEYYPMNTGYPILYPAIWSLVYKIQGSTSIWITSKLTMFYVPILLFFLLYFLYKENFLNKKVVLAFFVLIAPFIFTNISTNGYMDIPVSLLGFISLVCVYCADVHKEKKYFSLYLYASILVSAISIIVKQAGLFFFMFNIVYCIINYKYIPNKKKVVVIYVISLFYILTFLCLFYTHGSSGYTGNLDYLVSKSSLNFRDFLVKIWLFLRGYRLSLIVDFMVILVCPIMFVSSIISNFRNIVKLESLFFISYIIGLFIWLAAFSYDIRNSFWVQMFGAASLSIYLLKLKKRNILISIYVILASLLLVLMILIGIYGNKILLNVQNTYQSSIGNSNVAKELSNILDNKSSCVRVYSNMQMIRYNYFLNKHKLQIINGGYTMPEFVDMVATIKAANCADGGYLLIDPSTYEMPSNRAILNKLIDEHKITSVSGVEYLYFVTANPHKV